MFEIINILLLLMSGAGPTPVAGTNGTTAAFLASHAVSSEARSASVIERAQRPAPRVR